MLIKVCSRGQPCKRGKEGRRGWVESLGCMLQQQKARWRHDEWLRALGRVWAPAQIAPGAVDTGWRLALMRARIQARRIPFKQSHPPREWAAGPEAGTPEAGHHGPAWSPQKYPMLLPQLTFLPRASGPQFCWYLSALTFPTSSLVKYVI
jgi:hypothetical protein